MSRKKKEKKVEEKKVEERRETFDELFPKKDFESEKCSIEGCKNFRMLSSDVCVSCYEKISNNMAKNAEQNKDFWKELIS